MQSTFRSQRTISKPVTVTGYGFWSGQDVEVEFHPADPHHGIVFYRTDLASEPSIPALVENRIEVPRRTVLTSKAARVEMVEHICAALAGLQIDNCRVLVNAQEMPGCDGSALPFVAALDEAGIEEQSAARACLVIDDVTRVGDDDCWIEARPNRTGKAGLKVEYRLDFGPDNVIGRESIRMRLNETRFREELAPARTFVLKEEADWLRSQGLALRTSAKDVLVFDEEGPIDNELRFEDECVRHKALDVVGDLALAGCDIHGKIHAHRSGHRLNADLVRILLSEGAVRNG